MPVSQETHTEAVGDEKTRAPTLAVPPGPAHPPVASQSAEMELMDEMRCASIALAVSLPSSADQRLVQMMRSVGTQ